MKVSEWLRLYQISGEPPDVPEGDSMIAFWAGWLMGTARRGVTTNYDEAREMAIKVAEFIEEHVKS